MFRHTRIRTLATRTIVRDPRRNTNSPHAPVISNSSNKIETQDNNKVTHIRPNQSQNQVGNPMGLIDHRNPHQSTSTGAMLGSYVLAGVGVALGVGLVRLVLGV